MDLQGIIAISGKPGLFKVIAQGKNNVIVESLLDGRRFPAFASDRISALDDICIYTYEEDVPLGEVYQKLAEKENFGKTISHKESSAKLRENLVAFLPDYDEDRVYDNDIKKLFQWYNLLVDKDIIKKEEEKKETKKKAAKPKAKAEVAEEE